MRILIEGHKYEAAKVKDVLHGIDAMQNEGGYVRINYVGYFYNSKVGDCVFILPKALLEEKDAGEGKEDFVFGEYKPEDIINMDNLICENEDEKKEWNSVRKFIREFAVWIYRTIVVFKKDKRDSEIVYHRKIAYVGKGSRVQSDTFLDILLSLIRFNRDNRNFFFFVLRNLHSGYNKINWTRTISRSSAIVQDNRPIYLNPVNKKRQINFDEELLVIFFSILNYIGDKYGFKKEINCNFELIKGLQFETYLNGLGKTRLLQIKYKYFSDKALELWELCYAFFDNEKRMRMSVNQQEYLLVKNFNIVFEAIIDELIGDKDIPKGLKEQEDGKRVDHMYIYKGLVANEGDEQTYYIGDSKYYKMGNELGKNSIYKQYTYAKNVIQWNIDLFNSPKKDNPDIKLRDDLTEGYNIIPNFFISAKMDKVKGKRFDYGNDGVEETGRKYTKYKKYHFSNRLFDRDTLLLFHYDVNFLFVVSLYAQNNVLRKSEWKKKMREIFREDIREGLQKEFRFFR